MFRASAGPHAARPLELPASSARGKLALKTYMKMLLMLLVNQYASYAGTAETYQRQQQNLERLRPMFR